jgi:Uma2 family endonuclease
MIKSIPQTDPPLPARESLPTMYDLPSEEVGDPGMPDEFHALQAFLLQETFIPGSIPPDQVFSAVDMNLYYNPRRTDWYKRPDWFGVIGAPRLYEGRESRLSYVVWQEETVPLIVVELLSPRTEKEDLGQTLRDVNQAPTKWEVYESILRVPYYVVYGRKEDRMRIFKIAASRYTEIENHDGRFWIPEAGLGLGLWQGEVRGQLRLWLRWFDEQNNWIPTPGERAIHERQLAEQERQRAEQERQRADRLAEMLRSLGHDPDQI